jgi:tripartite-type tricarboxylate transporter receptor subunit TctC
VPYRGAAPAVNDLLAGQVQMVFLDLPILLPQIAAGKLKPIALGSERRADTLKDVPTTAEVGFPQRIAENWYGMVAPAGTPAPVVARLHAATVAALNDSEVKAKLASLGVTLVGNTPEVFAAYIRSETDKWAQVVKAAGIVSE